MSHHHLESFQEQWRSLGQEILETGEKQQGERGIEYQALWNKTLTIAPLDPAILAYRIQPLYTLSRELDLWMAGVADIGTHLALGIQLFRHESRVYSSTSYVKLGTEFQGIVQGLTKRPESKKLIIQVFDPEPQAYKSCMLNIQFYTTNRGLGLRDVNMIVTIRSSDFCLGLPCDAFQMKMYLARIAHAAGLNPGLLHINLGCVHVYNTHRETLREELKLNHEPYEGSVFNHAGIMTNWTPPKPRIKFNYPLTGIQR